MYDYIIAGGGPAGSTLARLIGETHSVLLIEKGTADSPEKLCGGLIAPDAQRMLGKFGLSLPNSILVDPQMFYVTSTDLNTGRSQKYQRHYLNVDRKGFDEWLLSLVPNKVDLMRNTRYLTHREGVDGLEVEVKEGSQRKTIKGRYLIAADGAISAVRRHSVGDFQRLEKYICLQSEIEPVGDANCYQVYFDRSITDFYGWAIPKGEKIHLGIALKGPKVHGKYESFLKQVFKEGYREHNRKGCHILRPRRGDFKTHHGSRVLFIGEAAGFISPSSAEGFSYAFKSALALAEAIEKRGGSLASHYLRKARPIVRELQLKRAKSLVMYSPILRNLIFKLGVGAL